MQENIGVLVSVRCGCRRTATSVYKINVNSIPCNKQPKSPSTEGLRYVHRETEPIIHSTFSASSNAAPSLSILGWCTAPQQTAERMCSPASSVCHSEGCP
jgi:hypothetical protein